MTTINSPRIADHMTRDQVAGRLTAWLGDSRKTKLESMVDSFVAAYGPTGAEECEQALLWAIHVAKDHAHADMDTTVGLAGHLADLSIDISNPAQLQDLRCRECE